MPDKVYSHFNSKPTNQITPKEFNFQGHPNVVYDFITLFYRERQNFFNFLNVKRSVFKYKNFSTLAYMMNCFVETQNICSNFMDIILSSIKNQNQHPFNHVVSIKFQEMKYEKSDFRKLLRLQIYMQHFISYLELKEQRLEVMNLCKKLCVWFFMVKLELIQSENVEYKSNFEVKFANFILQFTYKRFLQELEKEYNLDREIIFFDGILKKFFFSETKNLELPALSTDYIDTILINQNQVNSTNQENYSLPYNKNMSIWHNNQTSNSKDHLPFHTIYLFVRTIIIKKSNFYTISKFFNFLKNNNLENFITKSEVKCYVKFTDLTESNYFSMIHLMENFSKAENLCAYFLDKLIYYKNKPITENAIIHFLVESLSIDENKGIVFTQVLLMKIYFTKLNVERDKNQIFMYETENYYVNSVVLDFSIHLCDVILTEISKKCNFTHLNSFEFQEFQKYKYFSHEKNFIFKEIQELQCFN